MAPRKNKSKAKKVVEGEKTTIAQFKQFKKLPRELRLKIWDCFDDKQPKEVEVTTKVYESHVDENSTYLGFRIRSTTPIPPVLHVCSESRNEGLKRYKVFLHKSRDWSRNLQLNRTCFFRSFMDPTRDRILLRFNYSELLGFNMRRFEHAILKEATYGINSDALPGWEDLETGIPKFRGTLEEALEIVMELEISEWGSTRAIARCLKLLGES